MGVSTDPKRMRLRRDGVCAGCQASCPRGQEAWWFASERVVRCRACVEGTALVAELVGTAGASAQAEGKRRQERRQERLRERYGRLAPVVDLVSGEPQHTSSWIEGGASEASVGSYLERELDGVAVVLHDRRVPRSRANIDHVVVASSGVWVVDSKARSGKVEQRKVGPLLSGQKWLYVGGRNQTRHVEAMHRQRDIVEQALATAEGVRVRAALCLNGAKWGFFAHPLVVDGVLVTWPGDLVERVRASGELGDEAIQAIATRLATGLPPAS